MTESRGRANVKRINLALQGGGSHGAFTWGVMDRLFEDDRLEVDGLVGTSAGAMNTAIAAYGLAKGGKPAARQLLADFWKRISDSAKQGPLQPSWLDKMHSRGNMDLSPIWMLYDNLSKVFSPYELNPMNMNPLRDMVDEMVDFEFLHKSNAVKVFVCATNVLNGRITVFDNKSISIDAVMASACLPFLFQAVEIEGEYFWDGGYMGNPPIYPLIYHTDTSDVLIVQINPINIPDVPRTSRTILDRINTLSFNSSLMREMRTIHFVTQLIDQGKLDGSNYKRMNIHTVDAEMEMSQLSVSSKLNADWDFLTHLFNLGRRKAESFLERHFDDIGKTSTTDIQHKFM